jgi:uncharacterized membrane protein
MAVTSNFSVVGTASGGHFAATTFQRINSVDLLRGLVMVIMALDHTRDYFSNVPFPPEDLTRTSGILFFTRFITHYCAPVFFLLAGAGAFLATARGKSVQETSRFLWTRGLWLMFLELTIVGFGWTFVLPFNAASILWALGWSMVALAVLVRLPIRWIAGIGLTMVACHNLFDRVNPAWFGKFSWLWMLLHSPGFYPVTPNFGVLVLYSVIPWIGVMAVGYSLGLILRRQDRKKLLLGIGAAATVLFFLLRGINHYGNGIAGLPFGLPIGVGSWSVQKSVTLTVVSFFNTLKYPPSLDFLLMTLGPALIALALFDGLNTHRGIGRVLLVYGRVPMFYYILHIYLIHLMAILVAEIVHQPVAWLWRGVFFFSSPPAGYGHGLPFVYAMWILAVALLYLPCRWFMEFKKQHPDWNWLSYV